MTPEACTQARELLGWTRYEMASRARCSSETVKNFETGRYPGSARTRRAIRTALEAAGVEFVAESGDVFSVTLQKSAS